MEKLSHSLVVGICDYIRQKNLRQGQLLSTEQKLADKFGVSKSCIRQATGVLSFLGVIESVPKCGLRVGVADMGRIADVLETMDYPAEQLMKARVAIETGSLRYCIETILSDPLVGEELLDACRIPEPFDYGDYIENEVYFHSALVTNSGIEPLGPLSFVIRSHVYCYRDQIKARPLEDLRNLLGEHRDIVTLLSHGHLEKAEKLLYRHLLDS